MLRLILLTAALAFLSSCYFNEMYFQPRGDSLVLEGVIDGYTLEDMQEVLAANPGISRLVLQVIPGSADDEASLHELSRFIRDRGFTTVVPADGVVASGGTDMILMGATRLIEPGACVGVHTWAMGGLGGTEVGSTAPRSHHMHDVYLEFYRRMGIDEDFYWFTLKAAGPDDMHWMSEEEINRYGLATTPLTGSPRETAAQRRNRCVARLNL